MPEPSDKHETIENDVLCIMREHVAPEFGWVFDKNGIVFTLDCMVTKSVYGFQDENKRRPDFFLYPNDGYGLIIGEVGEMKSNKWDGYLAEDELPIRILRIGFDRSVGLLNPRFSEKEVKIIKILRNQLWRIHGAYEI